MTAPSVFIRLLARPARRLVGVTLVLLLLWQSITAAQHYHQSAKLPDHCAGCQLAASLGGALPAPVPLLVLLVSAGLCWCATSLVLTGARRPTFWRPPSHAPPYPEIVAVS